MFLGVRTHRAATTAQRSGVSTLYWHRPRQRGIGLIEILVAVVILAVGFLATARMQVAGMRFSQSAYFESQAYFMAGDMIARMRANVAGVRAGEYDNLGTAQGATNPGCSTKMCSPSEIADQDVFDWSQHLHSATGGASFVPLLPSSDAVAAQGSVARLAGGQYSVTIVWADDNANDQGQGALRVDLISED